MGVSISVAISGIIKNSSSMVMILVVPKFNPLLVTGKRLFIKENAFL